MDPPAVAASAEDAAGLGVQLAQDLYRLGSEYPNLERQIGSIAQAFVDLNLALADLASVLPCADKVLYFSPPCLGYLTALVERIHGVQSTFRSSLNDDAAVPASAKAGNSKKQQVKQAKQASLNKLGRLKTIFPGPGAVDRFTEMEWLRNTIALLAAVTRLSMTHAELGSPSNDIKQTGYRIMSETLTSAVLVYVRTITQKMADADDDSDDDEDPITGPGTLLFTAPASKSGESASASTQGDAAVWIYDALRDRINDKEPADRLPSVFVDWLLEETVDGLKPKPEPESVHEPDIVVNLDDVLTPTNNTFGTDTGSRRAAQSDDDEPDTVVPALPAPDAAPNPALLARRAKKKGKRKGKASNVYKYLVESEPEPESNAAAATSATDDEQHGGKHNSPYATATEDVETDQDTNSAKLNNEGVALAHKDAAASSRSHSRPSTSAGSEKARESKFESQFGLRYESAPDQDDLPPPYPTGNPNPYMGAGPPGRGAPPPFGTPQFPFPQPSPMPYQNGAQAPGSFDNGMPYMQGQPGMFPPVGFYPMGAPYGPQQFFGGARPGAPGVPGAPGAPAVPGVPGMTGAPGAPPGAPGAPGAADPYGYNDQFENQFPGRPLPGMRKSSNEGSRRDGPRGAGMAPKRRPAGTVLNANMFEEDDDDDDYDDDDEPDEGYARNRRGNARTRGRRDSYDSRSEDDFRSSASPEPPPPTKKERDKGKKAVNKGMRRQADAFHSDESDSEMYSTERDESSSLVRVTTHRGKKHEHAAPPRTAKKKGSSSKQPEIEEESDSDANDRRRHASETEEETYYVQQPPPAAPPVNVSSNSGKKRSAKGGAAANGAAKRNGRAGKSAPQASKQAPSPRSQLSDVDETEDNEGVKILSDSEEDEVRERDTARKSGKSRKDQPSKEKNEKNEKSEKVQKNEKAANKKKKVAPKPAPPRRRPAHEASSSDASSSDDHDDQYGDAEETGNSPVSDAKVFTPPPTPPDQQDEREHGRNSSPRAAPPPAPTPGVHNSSKADAGAPNRTGGPGGPKARQPIAHAIFPPAQMSAQQPQHHHRSMSANPFHPNRNGNAGREAAAGFGMPPPMDGAVKAALPGGLGPIGMRMGMPFWNGSPQGQGQGPGQSTGSDGAMTPRGPAPVASPWAAGIGAPPGQGPVPRTSGITSPTSWVRGGENPTRGGPPPVGASGPQPAPAAGPSFMKPIPWHGADNGRGYEDDYDAHSGHHSEYGDDEHDRYGHHESEDDYGHDDDEEFEYRDYRRPASPQYGAGYRHRSLSPPNNSARGHAAGPGPYGAYPPPPNARRPASDFRGPPPPQQPGAYPQFPPQQHPWQQPGPLPPHGQFPGGVGPQVPPSAADWGWPGDVKHPGGPGAQHPQHPQYPQHPHPQHPQHPGGVPMPPHMAYGQMPPPQQIGAPPPRHGGWDDPAAPPPGGGYPGGFNDGYR